MESKKIVCRHCQRTFFNAFTLRRHVESHCDQQGFTDSLVDRHEEELKLLKNLHTTELQSKDEEIRRLRDTIAAQSWFSSAEIAAVMRELEELRVRMNLILRQNATLLRRLEHLEPPVLRSVDETELFLI